MTATATDPLLPYTVLFLNGRGAVECSLVLAADAVSALGIAQARYAADASPATLEGGEDIALQDLGDILPAAECLAVYPGHQIGVAGGASPKPARPAAGAHVGAAPAPAPAPRQSGSWRAGRGRRAGEAAATAAWAEKRSDAIGQSKRKT